MAAASGLVMVVTLIRWLFLGDGLQHCSQVLEAACHEGGAVKRAGDPPGLKASARQLCPDIILLRSTHRVPPTF